MAGFAAGYQASGSLLAAAGLATMGEAAMFYGWVGVATMLAARRATAHLAGGGWRRLAAAYHAAAGQLASCAAAEVLDDLLIRPELMAGGAWLARPLPGGIWLDSWPVRPPPMWPGTGWKLPPGAEPPGLWPLPRP